MIVPLNKNEFESICFITNNNPNKKEILCAKDELFEKFINESINNVDYLLFKNTEQ